MSLAATADTLCTNNSDANFRAWVSMISTKLAAAGLVKSTETGEINLATVTAPAGTNTAQGFQVWKFADAFQATKPVFIKLEYGSGSAATTPSLWITIGSGSDGAGTLSGNATTRLQVNAGSQYTTNNLTSYFSGDVHRFVMALWISGTGATTGHALLVSFERSLDGAGAITNEAVLVVTVSGSGTNQFAWNTSTGVTTVANETSPGVLMPSKGSGSSGSQLSVYPVLLTKGQFFNPIMNLLCYFDADIPALSTIAFTNYGATHTYVTIGAGSITPGTVRPNTGTAFMMRYE